jgi:hypothetical protein
MSLLQKVLEQDFKSGMTRNDQQPRATKRATMSNQDQHHERKSWHCFYIYCSVSSSKSFQGGTIAELQTPVAGT